MLLAVLLSHTIAAPVESLITRIDRVGDAFSNTFTASNMKPLAKQIKISKAASVLSPEDAFKIDISCPGVSQANCDKAKVGLMDAGRLIAQNLVITKPIKVNATFNSFCQGNPPCDQSNVLGSARAASSFVVNQNGKNVMVSQGLLKQLKTNVQAPYSDVDIIANFNADYDWYFQGIQGTPIKATQSDFVYVSSHEITHGLGFGSGFLSYGDVFEGAAQPGYLAPIFLGAADDPNFNSNTLVKSLEPSDIFDTFLLTKTTDFNKIIRDISGFKKPDLKASEFLRQFESSGQPFNAAKQAYIQATSGNLMFKASDGTLVDLYSPNRYQQGSSISHVGTDNAYTTDFLMIPALAPGVTLAEAMKRSGALTLYGKKTLAIMKSIGWPTVDNPDPSSVRLSTTFGAGSHEKPLRYLLLVVVLVNIL